MRKALPATRCVRARLPRRARQLLGLGDEDAPFASGSVSAIHALDVASAEGSKALRTISTFSCDIARSCSRLAHRDTGLAVGGRGRCHTYRLDQPPFTCSRSRSTWRCSRSTVAASDAVDAEAAGAAPSWPFELTTTGWGVPPRVVPLIPAMNVAVWLPLLPIRIVPDSPATPALAMSMLFEPVVRF